MSADRTPTFSEDCRNILYGLRGTLSYVAERLNVTRGLYERWTTVVPESVKSVMFVCKGNICRSPLAAVYFQSLIEKAGRDMTVRSAGLETTPGKPAHANAKAVAVQHRLSLDGHCTTHVQAGLLDQSDLIIVMELRQKDRVQRLYPNTKGKVVLLGYFDSRGPLEIADPYSGTMEDFHACFRQMCQCCDILADRLSIDRSESLTSRMSVPLANSDVA